MAEAMAMDKETKKLRGLVERAEKCEFWGQPYTITPRLIAHKFGDGQNLFCITPMATRPNYFVARIDSSIRDPRDPFPANHQMSLLDQVMDAAEDEYGCFEEGTDEYFPVVDWGIGAVWGAPFPIAEWQPTPLPKHGRIQPQPRKAARP